MGTPAQLGTKASFASYQFDLVTGELSRFGIRLRLESQPAKVLALLIEAGGSLVSRSNLIVELWPGEVVGDFDRRLDKAVAKLRASLNDDPMKPRYIETLKGRGYRFIYEADIEVSDSGRHPETILPAQEQALEPPIVPGAIPISPIQIPPAPREWFQRLPAVGVFGGIAIVLLVVALLSCLPHRIPKYSHGQGPITLILPFQEVQKASKSAENAWLSQALTEWLSQDLNTGGELRLVQGNKYIASPAIIGTICNALPLNVVESVQRSFHPDLIIYGDYSATEPGTSQNQWRLNVCLEDTQNPKDTEPILVIGPKGDISAIVLSAGDLLRSKLGLKHLSDQELGYLRAFLPSNPAAARLYTEGALALEHFEPEDAVALLSKAEDLEPDHAATHAALSDAWATLGYQKKAVQEAQRAQQSAKGLSPEGQLEYEGLLEETTNDWPAASATYSQLVQLHPDSISYALKLARSQANAARPLLAINTVRHLRAMNQSAQTDPRVDLAEATADAVDSDFRDQLVASTRAENEATTAGASLLVADAEMEQGRADEMLGNWPDAIKLWQSAQQTYEAIDDRAGITDSLNSQGELLWSKAERDHALTLLNQSLKLSESSGDDYRIAKTLAQLGAIRKSTERQPDGGMPAAMAMLSRAAAIYHRIGNDAEEGYVVSVIADVAVQQTHYEAARALYLKAMQLSEASNDKRRIAGRILDLGIIDEWEGHNQEATSYFEDAARKFEQLGERDLAAIVDERLGQVLFYSGKVDEAELILQHSLTVLRSFGRGNELREALGNLVEVEIVKNPMKAEELARENLALNRSLGWDTSFCYASLAEAALANGDLKSANDAIYQAFLLALGQKKLPQEFLPFMLMYRGDVRMGNHDYTAAATDFKHSLALADQRGLPYYELESRLRIGELHYLERDFSAKQELDRVRNGADRLGFGIIAIKMNAFLNSTRPNVVGHVDDPQVGSPSLTMGMFGM